MAYNTYQNNPYAYTQMPVQQIQQQVQPQQPQTNIIWVQGIEGAKAHLTAPGNTLALWDSENNCIYIKSSDASGIPQPIRIFDYTERIVSQEPVVSQTHADYVTADQLNDILDEKLNALAASIRPYNHKRKGGNNEQPIQSVNGN